MIEIPVSNFLMAYSNDAPRNVSRVLVDNRGPNKWLLDLDVSAKKLFDI